MKKISKCDAYLTLHHTVSISGPYIGQMLWPKSWIAVLGDKLGS